MSDVAVMNAVRRVPTAVNEPIRSYAPGSPERAELKARLASPESSYCWKGRFSHRVKYASTEITKVFINPVGAYQ